LGAPFRSKKTNYFSLTLVLSACPSSGTLPGLTGSLEFFETSFSRVDMSCYELLLCDGVAPNQSGITSSVSLLTPNGPTWEPTGRQEQRLKSARASHANPTLCSITQSAVRKMSTPTEEKPVEKKKGLFRPHSLRVGDRITNASQLTLRETLWPLFLVTILYFLWVRCLTVWLHTSPEFN
jgi:hypothetical protein